MSARIEEAGRSAAATTAGGVAAGRAAVIVAKAEPNYVRLRAPFSLRCGALLIDYTLVIVILAFSTVLARLSGGSRAAAADSTVFTLGYLVAAAVAFLNFVVLAAVGGRTIGKWVTGLHIERKDGLPLSIARASLRHLVGYAVTILTLGLGFLLAAFNVEGRTLHDYIAGTVVVRDRSTRRDDGDAIRVIRAR